MKKTILITILCFFTLTNFAQVSVPSQTKQLTIDYTPINPQSGQVERLVPMPAKDTIQVFYWVVYKLDDVEVRKVRKTDCFISWAASDTYINTYQKFNAWIRETYNIE